MHANELELAYVQEEAEMTGSGDTAKSGSQLCSVLELHEKSLYHIIISFLFGKFQWVSVFYH